MGPPCCPLRLHPPTLPCRAPIPVHGARREFRPRQLRVWERPRFSSRNAAGRQRAAVQSGWVTKWGWRTSSHAHRRPAHPVPPMRCSGTRLTPPWHVVQTTRTCDWNRNGWQRSEQRERSIDRCQHPRATAPASSARVQSLGTRHQPQLLFLGLGNPLPHANMPFGVSWGKYLGTVAVSLGSMLAGASVVHEIFKPDLTVPNTPIPKPSGEVCFLVHPTNTHQFQDSTTILPLRSPVNSSAHCAHPATAHRSVWRL